MLAFFTILSKASGPYWSMLKRQLAEQKIAPLTMVHAPNLIGHPIGIVALIALGMFVMPSDGMFYLFWMGMVTCAAIGNIFVVQGLLETKFFTTQVIGSLGFVTSSLFAALFLNEQLNSWIIFSFCLAVLGVILFAWRNHTEQLFSFDRGMVFTIIAVLLGGLASVFYKLATFHVEGYEDLFTGRFITDLIGWTIIWSISVLAIGKNPIQNLGSLLRKRQGQIFVFGNIVITFLDSWLIYNLPVTTIAMLGTVAFPITYFISYFKYKERITLLMWLGTLCIIGSIIVYLTFR